MSLGELTPLNEQHQLLVTWWDDRLVSARLRNVEVATLARLLTLPASRELETLVLDLRTRRGDWPEEHTAALGLLAGLSRTAPASLRTLTCLTSSAWGVFDGLEPLEAALKARCPALAGPLLCAARPARVRVLAAGRPPIYAGSERVAEGAVLTFPLQLACTAPDPSDPLPPIGHPVTWNADQLHEGAQDPRLAVKLNGRALPGHASVHPGDVVELATGFRAELSEEEIPVRLTRFVKPVVKGQDPIECTQVFAEAMAAIAPELASNPKPRGQRGPHHEWRLRRELLRERHDVTWRSPSQMNPGHMYD